MTLAEGSVLNRSTTPWRSLWGTFLSKRTLPMKLCRNPASTKSRVSLHVEKTTLLPCQLCFSSCKSFWRKSCYHLVSGGRLLISVISAWIFEGSSMPASGLSVTSDGGFSIACPTRDTIAAGHAGL